MTWNIFNWPAGPFLTLYACLAVASLCLMWIVDWRFRQKPIDVTPDNFDPIELALLAKGPDRAAEVIALQLVQQGYLFIDEGRRRLVIRPHDIEMGAPPPQMSALQKVSNSLQPSQLAKPLLPWITDGWDRLARYGLVLSRSDAFRLRMTTTYIVGAVIVLGLVKACVGIGRGKPIGFLVLLIAATTLLAIALYRWRGIATASGRAALNRYERTNQRALSAPRAHEALSAFAVMGFTALVGTAFAGYAAVAKSTGNGGCGGGCGGDGGGGCGGCGGD